jgi:hypothetical protein
LLAVAAVHLLAVAVQGECVAQLLELVVVVH